MHSYQENLAIYQEVQDEEAHEREVFAAKYGSEAAQKRLAQRVTPQKVNRSLLRYREKVLSVDVAAAIAEIIGDGLETPKYFTYQEVADYLYDFNCIDEEGNVHEDSAIAAKAVREDLLHQLREPDKASPTSVMCQGTTLVERYGDLCIIPVNDSFVERGYHECVEVLAAMGVEEAKDCMPKRGNPTTGWLAIRADDPGSALLGVASKHALARASGTRRAVFDMKSRMITDKSKKRQIAHWKDHEIDLERLLD